ncbi:MAG TPA: choice-of-anchor tandem repeat GloVer-containing protein [Rhizomicrobium sp.]
MKIVGRHSVHSFGNFAGKMLAIGAVLAASAATAGEKTLYTFTNGSDGAYPFAGLTIDAKGNLYGAASSGGTGGQGTIFRIAKDGTFSVLYAFAGSNDGAGPLSAPLVDSHGNLYGTTESGGGSCNCGIVYKLSRKGKETVLHTFTGQPDGFNPFAPLAMDKSGNLYGTTLEGGTFYGTVFEVSASGNESILYSFGGDADGDSPYPGVAPEKHGTLLGSTSFGGTHGFGTIFQLASGGTKTVLYNFAGSSDAASPTSTPVRDSKGNIYGLAKFGGGSCNCGAMYKLSRKGDETLIHSFAGGNDGFSPGYGLTSDASGNFYGVTVEGGTTNCSGYGCGTVFKVSPKRKETILYAFLGGADGSTPYYAPVSDAQGKLYGTAEYDGANGYGTIYAITK